MTTVVGFLVWLNVGKFINGPLAEEHGLDDSETDKFLMDAEYFVELLRCHWVTDTNTFPYERQRVQLAAFTGSRLGVLFGITYRDLDLFLQRDATTGDVTPTLQLKLTKTKSRKKRKRP